MAYKYEKFDKLSDAVKAYESGDTVYYERAKDWYFQKTGNTFSMKRNYYRRIEVKPFECYGIVKQSTGFICAAGPYFYINHKKKKPYYESDDFKVIKLREVIEG